MVLDCIGLPWGHASPDSAHLGWDMGSCISSRFPRNADILSLWATLQVVRVYGIWIKQN